jgi:DNA polymerase III subunit epsilon
LTSYELLVAHNAAFDLRFINRELRLSGLPALTRPVYCTMKGYRALELGGSASLSAVCRRIKLARAGDLHSGIEDAWLAMQIYLWLHGCPLQIRLRGSLPRSPSNLRHAESGPYRVDHTGRTPFRHVRQARRASYSANLHHHGRPASRAKTASW